MKIDKIVDAYEIVWNDEVVDTADTVKNAWYLAEEYSLAFGGDVTFRNANEEQSRRACR